MPKIVAAVSLTFRHRWIGLAFIWVAAVPVDLLGLTYSDKAIDRISAIAYRLMGPKISVT